jgi:tRNA-modifying protein YgfZ
VATETPIELDAEYRQLREEAALVRRPTVRAIEVRGADAVDFLESQLTNDVASLAPGEGCYAALLDRKGHLQSDMRVLLIDPDRVWLVAENAGAERLTSHLGLYRVGREVEVDPLDLDVASVIGPAAAAATGIDRPASEHAHLAIGDGVRAIATAEGIDLLSSGPLPPALAAADLPEASEEAAEIVRVEAGRPRFGREMTAETMPAEAGIVERAVSFTKGCYIGQETVARLHYKGRPNRHLRGLRLEREAWPGAAVRLEDRELGRVGTAVVSPARGPIALAILRREAEPGARVEVGDPGSAAEVVDLPFASDPLG